MIPDEAASRAASLSAACQACMESESTIHIIAPSPSDSSASIDWMAPSSESR